MSCSRHLLVSNLREGTSIWMNYRETCFCIVSLCWLWSLEVFYSLPVNRFLEKFPLAVVLLAHHLISFMMVVCFELAVIRDLSLLSLPMEEESLGVELLSSSLFFQPSWKIPILIFLDSSGAACLFELKIVTIYWFVISRNGFLYLIIVSSNDLSITEDCSSILIFHHLIVLFIFPGW